METNEQVLELHPVLKEYIGKADLETRLRFTWIVENGFAGVFAKYLAGAGGDAIARFFRDFARVHEGHLLVHRQLLCAPAERTLGPADVAPVPIFDAQKQQAVAGADAAAGEAALASGAFAAVAFAGGAATRFRDGLDAVAKELPALADRLATFDAASPKGCFPISPLQGLNFYELFLAQALETGARTGKLPHCLLMTSGTTARGTMKWLEGAWLWGLPKEAVTVFGQNENPRLDGDGELVARRDGTLVWTGDGHGGVYAALGQRRGEGGSILRELTASGVRHIVMFNIDNPAARPFWPARLGRHLGAKAAFTISTVRKTNWSEKIGVACVLAAKGTIEVVEYNVLDGELARMQDGTGALVAGAGHINVNVIDTMALRYDLEPTLYRGKTVEVDGRKVSTSSMEFLNQHITRKLTPASVLFYEVPRQDFFMPTKNPTGADSVVTTCRMMNDQSARWLEAAGGFVPRSGGVVDATLELHPCTALDAADLPDRGIGKGWVLERDARVYLCARYSHAGDTVIAGPDANFGRGSTFIARVKKPYGDLAFNAGSRDLRPDVHSAGKLLIGRGVATRPGVRVEIDIEGDGELVISNGRVFSEDLKLTVRHGQTVTL